MREVVNTEEGAERLLEVMHATLQGNHDLAFPDPVRLENYAEWVAKLAVDGTDRYMIRFGFNDPDEGHVYYVWACFKIHHEDGLIYVQGDGLAIPHNEDAKRDPPDGWEDVPYYDYEWPEGL